MGMGGDDGEKVGGDATTGRRGILDTAYPELLDAFLGQDKSVFRFFPLDLLRQRRSKAPYGEPMYKDLLNFKN